MARDCAVVGFRSPTARPPVLSSPQLSLIAANASSCTELHTDSIDERKTSGERNLRCSAFAAPLSVLGSRCSALSCRLSSLFDRLSLVRLSLFGLCMLAIFILLWTGGRVCSVICACTLLVVCSACRSFITRAFPVCALESCCMSYAVVLVFFPCSNIPCLKLPCFSVLA